MRRMLIDTALMFPRVPCRALCGHSFPLIFIPADGLSGESSSNHLPVFTISGFFSTFFFFPTLQPSSQPLLAADFLIPILSPLHSTLGLALKLLCTTCSSNPISPTSSLYSSPSWFLHRSFGCFLPSLPLFWCIFLDTCVTDFLCYFCCLGHDAILVF